MEKNKKIFINPTMIFFFSYADILTDSIIKEDVLDQGDGLGEEI